MFFLRSNYPDTFRWLHHNEKRLFLIDDIPANYCLMAQPWDLAAVYTDVLSSSRFSLSLLEEQGFNVPKFIPVQRRSGILERDLRSDHDARSLLIDEREKYRLELVPFIVTNDTMALARFLDADCIDPALVRRINSKHFAKKLAESSNTPCVPGVYCEEEELKDVVFESLKSGPLFIKYEYSQGGIGNSRVEGKSQFELFEKEFPKRRERLTFKEGGFLVEPFIEHTTSAGVMCLIEETGIYSDMSDQIVKDGAYVGTRYPSRAKRKGSMLDEGEKLAKRLQVEGYKGCVYFDFMENKDGEFYLNEINARINASTAAMTLARSREMEFLIGEYCGKPGLERTIRSIQTTKDQLIVPYSCLSSSELNPIRVLFVSSDNALDDLVSDFEANYGRRM